MRWLKSIVVGFAFALCFSALADDRVARERLENDRVEPSLFEASIFGENESRCLDDEELADLRGRLLAPMGLQQAGVVLWDEPRKGLTPPPPRNGGEQPHGPSITGGGTIHR
jgi:hypothetical protein